METPQQVRGDSKMSELSPEDQAAWEALTKTVQQGGAAPAEKTPDENFAELFETSEQPQRDPIASNKATPQPRTADTESAEPDCPTPFAERNTLSPLVIGDLSQLDGNSADRLKRGKWPIDDTLDLHGMHKEAALDAFASAIDIASAQGMRLMLVITGKGQRSEGGRAILREALKYWLNLPALRPHLLACQPAHIKDGGEGAFYCLLKRLRKR